MHVQKLAVFEFAEISYYFRHIKISTLYNSARKYELCEIFISRLYVIYIGIWNICVKQMNRILKFIHGIFRDILSLFDITEFS